MRLSDYFMHLLDVNANTPACIYAYKEYIESKISDIEDFLTEKEGANFLSLPLNVDGKTIMGLVRSTSYFNSDSDDQLIDVNITEGKKIQVALSNIDEAIEENVQELKAQASFLSVTTKDAEKISVTDLTSKLQSALSDFAPNIIGKYSSFLEVAPTPLDAIKGFFETFKEEQLVASDEGLELVSVSGYTGSSLRAALTYVGDTIAGFFNELPYFWDSIGGWFEALGGAIVKLGQWIIGLIAPKLTSQYEEVSKCACGTLDFPLFQIDCGDDTEFLLYPDEDDPNDPDAIRTSEFQQNLQWLHYSTFNGNRYLFPLSEYKYCTNSGRASWSQDMYEPIKQLLYRDVEGVKVKRVSDFIIGTDDGDGLVLRLGLNKDNHVVLAGYPIVGNSNLGATGYLSDDLVFNSCRDIIKNAVILMNRFAPTSIDDSITIEDYAIQFSNAMLPRTYEGKVESFRIPVSVNNSGFLKINLTNNRNAGVTRTLKDVFAYMTVLYAGIMCNTSGTNYVNMGIRYDTYAPSEYETFNSLEPIEISTLPSFWKDYNEYFKPFLKNSTMPVKYHIQTTKEMGKEIVTLAVAVVVAVVGIAVSIKVASRARRARKNQTLRQVEVNQAASSVLNNPSKANVKAYNKALRRQRRNNRIAGLTGNKSASGVNSSNAAPVEENAATNFATLQFLISGENPQVD